MKVLFAMFIAIILLSCERRETEFEYKFNVGDTVQIMSYYDGFILDKKSGQYSVSYITVVGVQTSWLDERLLKSKK